MGCHSVRGVAGTFCSFRKLSRRRKLVRARIGDGGTAGSAAAAPSGDGGDCIMGENTSASGGDSDMAVSAAAARGGVWYLLPASHTKQREEAKNA